MKILVVCQYYYPENFIVYKVAEQFVKDGYEVHVLTGKPNYGYGEIIPEYRKIKDEIVNGVNVHHVNIHPRKKGRLSVIRNYLSFWRNSKKWVRRCKMEFDCVYSMSLSPVTICSAGNLYAKKHNVRHIIHCLDLWPESVLVTNAVRKSSFVYKLLYKWSRNIYSKATQILVSSPSFVDYFRDVLKLPIENISFVPQCALVENSELEPHKYGRGTHILYCGNLGTIQLIPLITEAMSKIERKDIFFHIIGMGPMSDNLAYDIKKRRLEVNVMYHGPIVASKAAAYFKSADALYISLKGEGTVGKTIPSKLLMSMCFARPIIGVLSGDGRDVLINSKGGIIAEENADSIKDAILKIADMSDKEKDHMGDLNKKYYNEHFSLEKISSLIEEVFRN